ncbi:MAG: hypothetical protein IPJ37_11470 [Bacteroidales bacterium]|nr:hypothetical protein [Bacteroidales bacterium]
MMKRTIIFVLLTSLLTGISGLRAQELTLNEEINKINSILKSNPYRDTFMEITFYYSIEITQDEELIVSMEFNGPLKTKSKARIADLNLSFQIDTALEGTSSVCWYCKTVELSGKGDCVYGESITTQGAKETHYSDNMCGMITRDAVKRDQLIKAFGELFRKVIEK